MNSQLSIEQTHQNFLTDFARALLDASEDKSQNPTPKQDDDESELEEEIALYDDLDAEIDEFTVIQNSFIINLLIVNKQ